LFHFQEAPKDKLLVFSVTEGWEPLCKFLEKDVPEIPFPWKNIGGKEAVSEKHMRQFKRQFAKEMLILLICFLAFLFAVYFYVNDYDWWKSLSTFLFGLLTWYFFL